MDILRSRLVLPVRAFVEAEKIASELVGDGQIRIGFIDPEQRTATPPISTRDVGDTSAADELDALLTPLPTMIIPAQADAVCCGTEHRGRERTALAQGKRVSVRV